MVSKKNSYKFGTLAIHGGQKPDPATGAVMPPIYQTSTYAQKEFGAHQAYEYSRTANPTRSALENSLAALEGGAGAACFGSGMAAIDALIKLLEPGDELISTNDLYGGTYRLFNTIFAKYGIVFKFLPIGNLAQLEEAITPKTKMIWVETPTNPMLNVIDVRAVSAIAKKANALLVVDNTFATPYLQQPIQLGADLVMHSATKYLGGHSDVVLGAVVAKTEELAEKIHFIQNASGAICGPMDSFLALRGIKTLHVRMNHHCKNGEAIAHFLQNHPKVGDVYWPGFKTHPNHEIANSQMSGFGGMLSFNLKNGGLDQVKTIISHLNVFTLAESLGGVESLVGHPATMTHASIPKNVREKTGIVDSLIRLSVGIEDQEDLIFDLEQALEKI